MHWRVWLGFETHVAIRFLREGRLQTVLIMVGVAAGAGAGRCRGAGPLARAGDAGAQ